MSKKFLDLLSVEDKAKRVREYNKKFETAKKRMAKQIRRWRNDEDLYYNTLPFVEKNETQLQLALPLAVVNTIMPIVADNMPSDDVVAENQESLIFASKRNDRKNMLDNKSGAFHTDLEVAEDSLKYGNGMSRLSPILDEEGSLIGLEDVPVDLFTWFPAPHAVGMDIRKQADHHIFAVPMSRAQVMREFREVEGIKGLKGEGNLDEYRSFKEKENTEQAGGEDDNDWLLVKWIYIIDPDDDSDLFPDGRVFVWCNQMPLDTAPIDGMMPYFLSKNYSSHRKIMGVSEVRLVRTPAFSLNEVMSQVAENIKKVGTPLRTIIERLWTKMSGTIPTGAGVVIPVKDHEDIKDHFPPPMQAHVFNYINILRELINDISGRHDVLGGKQPPGDPSGVLYQSLLEAAYARVRYKVAKEIRPYKEAKGRYKLYLMEQYDKKPVSIRKKDRSNRVVFSTYNPINSIGEQIQAGHLTEKEIENIPEKALSLRMTDAKLSIDVVAGNRLPLGRVAGEARATELYFKKMITYRRWVMHSLEVDKEDLIIEMEEDQKIAELRQRIEFQQKALVDFSKMCEVLMMMEKRKAAGTWTDQDQTVYGWHVDQMCKLVQQYKDLVDSQYFNDLPLLVKNKIRLWLGGEQKQEV